MEVNRVTKIFNARALTMFVVAILIISTQAAADDWPQWQGPNRNAVSQEKGLLQQWPEGGPPLAWRIDGLGGGDSAPAVVGGKLYGMSTRDGKEVVWALSETDGKELWVATLGDEYEQSMPQSKEGPGGTPTVDGDRLYVIGMGGRVACLSATDGSELWQRSLTDDFGGLVPRWSFRESPLVDGEKLICTPGGLDAMIVALDKMTGETLWRTATPSASDGGDETEKETNRPSGGRRGRSRGGPRAGAAYSSAIAIDFEGERQYVQMTAKSLIGVAASDGRLLWRYPRTGQRDGYQLHNADSSGWKGVCGFGLWRRRGGRATREVSRW